MTSFRADDGGIGEILVSRDDLADRVLALGKQHGFRFTAQEVESALQEGGRAGAGRWIVR